MPIPAGGMNHRAQFVRAGADLGDWQWCRYRFERVATVSVAGQTFQGKSAQLTVRRCAFTESLTDGDRVRVGSDLLGITLIRKPEADSDDMIIEVESAPSAGLYASEVSRRGEMVTLVRDNDDDTVIKAQVRARVWGFAPNELVGDIDQGTRQLLILAEDVAASGFPLPIRKNDRILVRGNPLNIQSVDDSTHREGGVLNAYYVIARGA